MTNPMATDSVGRTLCTAHNRKGERCTEAAISGATVCRFHGGKAPQVLARIKRDRAISQARNMAAELITGWPDEIENDPLANLLRMVQTAAMAERAYAVLIADLEDVLERVDYGKAGGQRDEPHAYVKLWNDERDRLAKVCKLALDAGVEQKQVEIAQRQADAIVNVITAVLSRLGFDDETRQKAMLEAGNELRKIAA